MRSSSSRPPEARAVGPRSRPGRRALSAMGDLQGLEVVVIDRLADAQKYPAASRLVTDDPLYDQLAPSVVTTSSSRPSTRATTAP